MSKILSSLDISVSALLAQKKRMDVIAENIANAETIQTDTEAPYRRKAVSLEAMNSTADFNHYLKTEVGRLPGVRVSDVSEDDSPFKLVYDPSNPFADEDGYVTMSNVDTTKEMLDMLTTTRAYEANITVLNSTKGMIVKGLEIGK